MAIEMMPEPSIKFDLPLARKLAEFSRRAYLDKLPPKMPGSIFNVMLYGDLPGSRVLIEDIGDALVLAFPGTENLRDWITDAQFMKERIITNIMVHAGFLARVDSLLPKIIKCLNGNSKPLLLTGHSLGASEASLTGFCLSKSNYVIRSIYTFGSPRVGNAAFRTAYNASFGGTLGKRTFRVVAAGDLVPLIPGLFCPPTDGYRHVGTEVFFQQKYGIDSWKINPSRLYEISRDSWRVYRALERGDLEFITQFHSIDNDYQKLLA